MISITKSRDEHFGGNLDVEQFRDELLVVLTKFRDIMMRGHCVDILFESALDAGELVLLETAITNHSPNYEPKRRGSHDVSTEKRCVKNTAYRSVGVFNYSGTIKYGIINFIDFLCYKDPDITSFDIKVVDRDTLETMGEAIGLTNNDLERKSVGTITGLKTTVQTLEFLVRKNGGADDDKVHVDGIKVYK